MTMNPINDKPVGDFITGFLGLINVFLHAAVIFVVLKPHSLRKNKSNQLLLNLSLGHVLTGASNFLGLWINANLSNLTYGGYIYGVLSLLMLTIDRCLLIQMPFKYNNMPVCIHIFFLVISPTITVLYLVDSIFVQGSRTNVTTNETEMKKFIYGIAGTIILLAIPNFLIYLTLQRQKKRIKALQVSSGDESTLRHNVGPKEMKAFYVCLGCVMTFGLLWLPALSIKVLELYFDVDIPYKYFSPAVSVAALNPLADAVVFVWFNKSTERESEEYILPETYYGNYWPYDE